MLILYNAQVEGTVDLVAVVRDDEKVRKPYISGIYIEVEIAGVMIALTLSLFFWRHTESSICPQEQPGREPLEL